MGRIRSPREFSDELDAIGEVQRIDAEVEWRLEIGAGHPLARIAKAGP